MNVSLGFLASLLPTFYPLEAESRGARPFEYGFVFGVVSLSRGLLSPLSGALAVKFGIKKSICVGAIVESLCGIFFAFLSVSHDVAYFIGLLTVIIIFFKSIVWKNEHVSEIIF